MRASCLAIATALFFSVIPISASFAGTSELWRNAEYGWTDYVGHPFAAREGATLTTFKDKMWVIGGLGNQLFNDVWYSTDGQTWTEAAAGPFDFAPYQHSATVHDGKLRVIAERYGEAEDQRIWSSPDGVEWSLRSTNPVSPFRESTSPVSFDGRLWLVGGSASGYPEGPYFNDVWNSADGVNWTRVTATAEFSPREEAALVEFQGKLWLFGGKNTSYLSDVWWTEDGEHWTLANADAGISLLRERVVEFRGELWTPEGWRSPDGVSWTFSGVESPALGAQLKTASRNELRVVGSAYTYHFSDWFEGWHSPDGLNWSDAHASGRLPLFSDSAAVVFNDRMWVIGGTDNGIPFPTARADVYSSSDGRSWVCEKRWGQFDGRMGHTCLVFGDRLWVVAGGPIFEDYWGKVSTYPRNDVWSSPDGRTWVEETGAATFPARSGHSGTVFDGRMWVIGGRAKSASLNDAWSSADGVTWEAESLAAGFSARFDHTTVAYDGKLWVIGGRDSTGPRSDVWWSADGAAWTEATSAAAFSPRRGHTSVVHNGRMWVIGGADSAGRLADAWSSADGISWTEETALAGFAERSQHTSLAYDGKLWTIGGYVDTYTNINDTWCSLDGAAWEQVGGMSLPPRRSATKAVFDGRLWLFGGYDREWQNRDSHIWASSNGYEWSRVAADVPYPARRRPAVLEFDNRIWQIGGLVPGSDPIVWLDDVWSSPDGVNWTLETDAPGFAPRAWHQGLAHDGKMWIMGGWDDVQDFKDVWSSPDGVNWTRIVAEVTFPIEGMIGSVIFNDQMWLFPYGADYGAWHSSDGLNWSAAPLPLSFFQYQGLPAERWDYGLSTSPRKCQAH